MVTAAVAAATTVALLTPQQGPGCSRRRPWAAAECHAQPDQWQAVLANGMRAQMRAVDEQMAEARLRWPAALR